MKREISICLAMLCIAAFSWGFVGCSGEQVTMETKLSDDLNSRMFSLDGVVYTLPVHFSLLEANGWSFCDVENGHYVATDILEPGANAFVFLTNGDLYTEKTFTNLSEGALPVSESYITDASAHFLLNHAPIIFPGNIMLVSTYEDVIAAYGEPENRRVFEESRTLFYSSDCLYFIVMISIDNETNLVIVMDMRYMPIRN